MNTTPHRAPLRPLLAALCALYLSACSDLHGHEHGEHGEHADEAAGHGDAHGHGHGHGHEGASEAVTRWGAQTQLFVEFPALVQGAESPFAAHLTRLDNHQAISEGRLEVTLSGGGQPDERFTVEAPAVAGIFRPIVAPRHAVKRDLTLHLTSPQGTETHHLGAFEVFPSAHAAEEAAKLQPEEPAGQIAYLLEQQWKVPFHLTQSHTQPLQPSLPVFGRLVTPPDAEVLLIAPRAGRSAPADRPWPTPGDDVAAGAPLLALAVAPSAEVDPAQLRLGVEQASVQVQAAQRDVQRLTPLVEAGAVAPRRLEEAQTLLASAQAELRAAQRRQRNLAATQQTEPGAQDTLPIASPLEGTLVELSVAPGTWVTPGQPLGRVVQRRRLWLELAVPEAYLGRLRSVEGVAFQAPGQPQERTLDRAALLSVGAAVDPAARTLPVRFALDNSDLTLFAGATVQAHLHIDAPRPVTAVPTSALIDDAGVQVVYVQTGGESFERRPVKLGIRAGGLVEIQEGVAPGEWVVDRGAYLVKLAATSTSTIGHGHAH